MTDSRHQEAKALFFAAIEHPPEARDAFLRPIERDDPDLYREVVSLLAFHEDQGEAEATPEEPARHTPLLPGSRFAERYTILERLGQGGMGVVYKARDQVLETVVALKFLVVPNALNKKRLLKEVRLAREIAHPNVCRVYDVGQSGGELFFSMEFVQGENLSARLHRVGRLPPEEVLHIARQLCAGLAAAHARGVLHRDLKPANIMVDSGGSLRITDFGIATLANSPSARLAAGTLGYMAPEQLLDIERVDERSDLYAVGLVLHELLTGIPVFKAKDERALIFEQLEYLAEAPSWKITGIPKSLDRVIERAICRDLSLRPSSALEMAAELGGGDVLAIASKAGLTPSPSVVFKANIPQRVSWWLVGILLLLTLAGLVLLFWLTRTKPLVSDHSLQPSPQTLAQTAETIIEKLGYAIEEDSEDFGFLFDPTSIGEGSAALFWFRWDQPGHQSDFSTRVLEPSADLTGMTPKTVGLQRGLLTLTTKGRLISFLAPPGGQRTGNNLDDPDLFALMGLSQWETASADDQPPPPVFADHREFITGQLSTEASPVKIQLARYRGQLVYLETLTTSNDSDARLARKRSDLALAEGVSVFILFAFVLVLPLAWRNLNRGRSDRLGARRAAGFVGITALASVIFSFGRPIHPLVIESGSFLPSLGLIALVTFLSWLAYMSFEPTVRRHWPRTLVAWTRLLRGRWRDPMIGNALLTGSCGGVWLLVLERLIPPTGAGLDRNVAPALNAGMDAGMILSTLCEQLRLAVYQSLILLLFLALLRFIFRRKSWAIAAFILLFTLPGLIAMPAWQGLLVGRLSLSALLIALILARQGLLTLCVALFFHGLLDLYLLDADLGVWYGAGLKVSLCALAVFAIAGSLLATRPAKEAAPGPPLGVGMG